MKFIYEEDEVDGGKDEISIDNEQDNEEGIGDGGVEEEREHKEDENEDDEDNNEELEGPEQGEAT